jgi:hypothetical protein
MSENTSTLEATWCVVDLFGHQRLAGQVSEQEIAGHGFVRVDVSQVDDIPAFTRFLGHGAIYSITPCNERTARGVAAHARHRPVSQYEVLETFPTQQHQLPAVDTGVEDDDIPFSETPGQGGG